MELNFNSVETIPLLNAAAAFQIDSSKVFKEDTDIVPVIIDDTLSYIPWGADNNLPFHILDLIESDETLSTCQQFNAGAFPSIMSRLENQCIYIDPRISFNEIDRYFFSGCACAYFQIAVDVFTDLRLNPAEWDD